MRYDFTYVQAVQTKAWHARAEALVNAIVSLFRRTR
jgi:hypothetical protein